MSLIGKHKKTANDMSAMTSHNIVLQQLRLIQEWHWSDRHKGSQL